MGFACDIIIKWKATPYQLAALGTALWRWCSRTAGHARIYQYLDNQALADLMAGRFPVVNERQVETNQRGAHFRVRDRTSRDCRAAIETLRLELPTDAIEDIFVDDISWNAVAPDDRTSPILHGDLVNHQVEPVTAARHKRNMKTI